VKNYARDPGIINQKFEWGGRRLTIY